MLYLKEMSKSVSVEIFQVIKWFCLSCVYLSPCSVSQVACVWHENLLFKKTNITDVSAILFHVLLFFTYNNRQMHQVCMIMKSSSTFYSFSSRKYGWIFLFQSKIEHVVMRFHLLTMSLLMASVCQFIAGLVVNYNISNTFVLEIPQPSTKTVT